VWTPLYITLSEPVDLTHFVETLARMMGNAAVEWRQSSNYVEERYANLRTDEAAYRACIADESDDVLKECHFQVDVDADNRFSDEALVNQYAEEVAKKFVAIGWKVVFDVSRGRINGELKYFQ
jgi:hypothetical protein